MNSFRSVVLLTLFLIIVSLNACSQKKPVEKSLPENQYVQKLNTLTLPIPKTIPKNIINSAYTIKYGLHKRQDFDIFLAKHNGEPTPLVLYVHGGGFTSGDKTKLYRKNNIKRINYFLEKGISVATTNYRYLQHSNEGVISSMQDVMRVLQYIRFHSKSLNIQPNKIACQGSSAGAGTCLWLAVRDDMANAASHDVIAQQSTRLTAATLQSTQATYDVLKWKNEVFSSYLDYLIIRSIPLGWYPGANKLSAFYGIDNIKALESPQITKYRQQVDMLAHISADDPPIWVENKLKDEAPINTSILYHSPLHAQTILNYSKQAKHPYVIRANALNLNERSNKELSFNREVFVCEALLDNSSCE